MFTIKVTQSLHIEILNFELVFKNEVDAVLEKMALQHIESIKQKFGYYNLPICKSYDQTEFNKFKKSIKTLLMHAQTLCKNQPDYIKTNASFCEIKTAFKQDLKNKLTMYTEDFENLGYDIAEIETEYTQP